MEQTVTKKKSRKKTVDDYENIFSKMIFLHNTETVPFLKELNSSSVKIRKQRILLDIGRLERGELSEVYNIREYFSEYLLMNKFIVGFLDQAVYKNCLELIYSNTYRDNSNLIIAANMLYTLIEDKKKEIIEKLNGK